MSNPLLKQLRERGTITGPVWAFASASKAESLAQRLDGTVVMVLKTLRSGGFWVVTEADAKTLQAEGYKPHTREPPG